MTLTPGVIDPSKSDPDDLFVGYAPTPLVDRRFLMAALPLGAAALSGASWLSARKLDDPGAGDWRTGETHQITGALIAYPYPMIRMPAPDAPFGVRTALVVATGKCTSALDLRERRTTPVTASGVLIRRKERQMLEVPPFAENWLAPADLEITAALADPETESLGKFRLAGQIMDSKCFFGVMRPGRGKTHKACASLCIRGGIPPSFWARNRAGREVVLLMTDERGAPISKEILPFVADPVEAQGEIIRVGDLLEFRVNMRSFRRL
jgi:hypothetical protein